MDCSSRHRYNEDERVSIDFKRLKPVNLKAKIKCKRCECKTRTTVDYKCEACKEDNEKQYYSIRFLEAVLFKYISISCAGMIWGRGMVG